MMFRGRLSVRWVSRGHETRFTIREGSFHYLPADGERHSIVAHPTDGVYTFMCSFRRSTSRRLRRRTT